MFFQKLKANRFFALIIAAFIVAIGLIISLIAYFVFKKIHMKEEKPEILDDKQEEEIVQELEFREQEEKLLREQAKIIVNSVFEKINQEQKQEQIMNKILNPQGNLKEILDYFDLKLTDDLDQKIRILMRQNHGDKNPDKIDDRTTINLLQDLKKSIKLIINFGESNFDLFLNMPLKAILENLHKVALNSDSKLVHVYMHHRDQRNAMFLHEMKEIFTIEPQNLEEIKDNLDFQHRIFNKIYGHERELRTYYRKLFDNIKNNANNKSEVDSIIIKALGKKNSIDSIKLSIIGQFKELIGETEKFKNQLNVQIQIIDNYAALLHSEGKLEDEKKCLAGLGEYRKLFNLTDETLKKINNLKTQINLEAFDKSKIRSINNDDFFKNVRKSNFIIPYYEQALQKIKGLYSFCGTVDRSKTINQIIEELEITVNHFTPAIITDETRLELKDNIVHNEYVGIVKKKKEQIVSDKKFITSTDFIEEEYKISNAHKEFMKLIGEKIEKTKTELTDTKTELTDTKTELTDTKTELTDTKSKIDRLAMRKKKGKELKKEGKVAEGNFTLEYDSEEDDQTVWNKFEKNNYSFEGMEDVGLKYTSSEL